MKFMKGSNKSDTMLSNDQQQIVRSAVLNTIIPNETAQRIAKLVYATAALTEGIAEAQIELHWHDGSDFEKLYGGPRFLCVRMTTKFGRTCIAFPEGTPCKAP